LPQLTVGDASVTDGDSGTAALTFTIKLSAASTGAITVAYATSDQTATAGSDYLAASGTLTFAAGQTQKTVTVQINGDTVYEPDETLLFNLSSPTGATLGRGQAVGKILNDDAAPVVPVASISDVTVTEGNSGSKVATFTLTLSQPTTQTVTVAYATSNGTATAGSDYQAISGSVTFAPGITAQTISVTIFGDTVVETNETFSVLLSNPVNATLGTSRGTGTIVDDDGQQAAGIAVAFKVVSDWGTGFTADMTIKNNTATAVHGWTLEFDFDRDITGIWNALIVSHVGKHYVLKNAAWNADILPGQTIDFGFQGTTGNVLDGPKNIVFNGSPV
jgi:hypothetical protein